MRRPIKMLPYSYSAIERGMHESFQEQVCTKGFDYSMTQTLNVLHIPLCAKYCSQFSYQDYQHVSKRHKPEAPCINLANTVMCYLTVFLSSGTVVPPDVTNIKFLCPL